MNGRALMEATLYGIKPEELGDDASTLGLRHMLKTGRWAAMGDAQFCRAFEMILAARKREWARVETTP